MARPLNPSKATNQTSFKKGASGNPRGRPPKGQALTELLKARGEETTTIEIEVEDEKTGKKVKKTITKTWKEILVERLWAIAVEDPDSATSRYIIDRIDGRPKETVKHEGDVEAILIKYEDA